MMIGRDRLLAIAFAASAPFIVLACASTPRRPTALAAPGASAHDGGRSPTTRACSRCHANGASPDLVVTAALAREDALRAAMMVASRRMPPSPAVLEDEERSAIIDELCAVAGLEAKCPAKPYSAPPLVVGANALIQLTQQAAPRDGGVYPASSDGSFAVLRAPPNGTFAEEELARYLGDRRVNRLDTNVLLLTALMAAERCGPADAGRFDDCAAHIIDNPSARIPK